MKDTKLVRCAIYTRKSTEEGLEQAFNSLDAQREACAAYIDSQKHEGWKIVRAAYDDGGFSGATIDRPGMQRLLADVDAGLIDVVVVYKIDRLTRSLTDFARIVERFDKRAVSFVSVTQSFNTTTSMGRLTLNVLLSFAQFEREVTAERIRDKFAASRARGIFMGGCPPLGYDAKDRKLIVNEQEAVTIRMIFDRYLKLGSVGNLVAELRARGITTKAWVSIGDRKIGGGKWYTGALSHVLRNRVYVGAAVHKGKVYAGEHAAILPRETFDAVQALLDGNRIARADRIIRESPGLLTGLIFDERGNAMSPQETCKLNGLRHVYYVCQALLQHCPQDAGTLPRVSARAVENLVIDRLKVFTGNDALGSSTAETRDRVSRQVIRKHVSRVTVSKTAVVIEFLLEALVSETTDPGEIIEAYAKRMRLNEKIERSSKAITLSIAINIKTRGGSKRIEGWDEAQWTSHRPRLNDHLIKSLAQAHQWRTAIEAGNVTSLDELAKRERVDRKQMRQTLRLAFLAPDIQRAIVNGQQPENLSLTALLDRDIPSLWTQQRQLLGLAASRSDARD